MSQINKTWSEWLNNSRFSSLPESFKKQILIWLFEVRDKVLDRADLKPNDILLDVGTGTGLLAFGAYEILKDTGKVVASDAFSDCLEECKKLAENLKIENKIDFLLSDATDIKLSDASVDVIVMRSVLMHILDKPKAINEFFRVLKPNGRLSFFEGIMSKNTKFYELINPDNFPDFEKLKELEDKISSDKNDSIMNFNEDTLKNNLEDAGFKTIDVEIVIKSQAYEVTKEMIEPWFDVSTVPGQVSLREKYLQYFSQNELNDFIERLKIELDQKIITMNTPVAFISAEK